MPASSHHAFSHTCIYSRPFPDSVIHAWSFLHSPPSCFKRAPLSTFFPPLSPSSVFAIWSTFYFTYSSCYLSPLAGLSPPRCRDSVLFAAVSPAPTHSWAQRYLLNVRVNSLAQTRIPSSHVPPAFLLIPAPVHSFVHLGVFFPSSVCSLAPSFNKHSLTSALWRTPCRVLIRKEHKKHMVTQPGGYPWPHFKNEGTEASLPTPAPGLPKLQVLPKSKAPWDTGLSRDNPTSRLQDFSAPLACPGLGPARKDSLAGFIGHARRKIANLTAPQLWASPLSPPRFQWPHLENEGDASL